MECVVITDESDVASTMAAWVPGDSSSAPERDSITIGTVGRVPGAVGSWYEVAAAIGVLSLPTGIISGLISNWIFAGLASSRSRSPQVHLVIRHEEREVELVIANAELSSIAPLIAQAIHDVDKRE